VAALDALLTPGETVAFLGSSGVGKSSLVNRLLEDERQLTSAVRAGDDRGRHTTTVRELFALPNGTLVIDSPGIREVAAWRDGAELDQMGSGAFEDIESLAEQCRFRDCRHEGEPGCAVEAAVAAGELDEKRLIHYRKLRDEREQQGERQAKAEKIHVKRRRKATSRPKRPLDELDEDDLL
jgi:ribosome biogenesis GTPase